MSEPDFQDSRAYTRRNDDGIAIKLELLHADVNGVKDVLRELTVAINRLALVEERQTQTAQALERAFIALKEVEQRVAKLELSNVNTSRTSSTVDNIATLVIVSVVVAVLTYIGVKK